MLGLQRVVHFSNIGPWQLCQYALTPRHWEIVTRFGFSESVYTSSSLTLIMPFLDEQDSHPFDNVHAATKAGFAEYIGLPGAIKAGCQQFPAKFCYEHSGSMTNESTPHCVSHQ